MSNLTTSYKYDEKESEYVFSCRGRPFTSLVSSTLPESTSTLIDYELVRDLKIKMSDLQCKRFNFAGFKMRILGQISTAVQCINDGFVSGNFHFKAMVVLDLAKNLDTFSVAGKKLASQLSPSFDSSFNNPPSPKTQARTSAQSSPARTSSPHQQNIASFSTQSNVISSSSRHTIAYHHLSFSFQQVSTSFRTTNSFTSVDHQLC